MHLEFSKPTHGLMFIGDPHIWSHRPGRRRDESYLDTIINKMFAAARISNETGTWPLILGDLFDKARDHEPSMLIALTEALQAFERKPMTLVGNHDKHEKRLTNKNALRLLEVTQQLYVLDEPGLWATLDLTLENQKQRVLIGGTPYGAPLSNTLASMAKIEGTSTEDIRKANQVEHVVWLTHDDLAFEGAYPNAQALIEIEGIDILVNGHMHATKKPVKMGQTAYYNPGNISRMSVDMADHIPRVWTWTPFNNPGMPSAQGLMIPQIKGHELPHKPGVEIFDFEGRHAQPAMILPTQSEELSAFVQLIKNEKSTERTDEAILIQNSLAQVWESQKTPKHVQILITKLLSQAIEKHHLKK